MAMNVNDLIAALTKIAEAGHGDALVITHGRVDVRPVVKNYEARYIGPSEWDNYTYAKNEDHPGTTVFV